MQRFIGESGKHITSKIPGELLRQIYLTYLKSLNIDDRRRLGIPPGKIVPPPELIEALKRRLEAVQYHVESPTNWTAVIYKANDIWWMEYELVEQEMNVYFRGNNGGFQIWPKAKSFNF